MKSILLVLAAADLDLMRWINKVAEGVKYQKGYVVPLNLATIAALTPAHYRVQIWDEAIQGRVEQNLDQGYDLVGISAFSKDLERAKLIADTFRAKGIPVVIGGAGVTDSPEKARGHFDAIFIGEAEMTWPQFLVDFEAGKQAEVYQSHRFTDLALSPPPRWDSIAHLLADNYKMGGVQTTNGCPHQCEFCNAWVKFGRKIRTKPIPQVLEEIATLERLGMKRVMFCSDNFMGNRKQARELVRALVPLNASFRQPLRFTAEITLNVAKDDEMLGLLAAAGFNNLIIGIESTNMDSLKETRKFQNTHADVADQCLKIASYGIPVVGSLIVGFDNDTTDVFDAQFDLIQEACIPLPRLNILKAGNGTDLYHRILAEGRLIDMAKTFPGHEPSELLAQSNIVPRKMTRKQMFSGMLGLVERVWHWQNFQARIVGFIDNLNHAAHDLPDERLQKVVANMRLAMQNIPEAELAIIDEIFTVARARAPGLLWEIASMTMVHCFERARLPATRQALLEQIRLEEQLEAAGGPILLEPLSA